MERNNGRLRIGVVGLGKMGVMHACLLNTFPNVEVAALCDKSRLMRSIAKHAFPRAFVTGELEKFGGLDLDAIYILTPIPSHYSLLQEVYNKSLAKNVFVEKTLSSDYTKSQDLIGLSEKTGGVNMVGYMKRFGVTFNHVRGLLDKQVLGDLEYFDGYAFSSDFADAPEGSTASNNRGGVSEDLGSHIVDLALWLFGDLKVTDAKLNMQIAPTSEDDISFGVVGKDGIEGHFDVSWCRSGYRMPEFGLRIQGAKGAIYVNDDEVRLELSNSAPQSWYRLDMNDNVGYFLGGAEYWRENRHFLECVASGLAPKSDFRSALKVDFLLDQVRGQIA
ncbi:MAG: Gfo/Idh/MocA family protein [Candidatus Bathyarchaeia archaeon]|jgi:predicted dehydrogenase